MATARCRCGHAEEHHERPSLAHCHGCCQSTRVRVGTCLHVFEAIEDETDEKVGDA